MTIGFLQMELLLPDTKSLKDKRSLLKKMSSQIRKNYNVAFSELSENDSLGRAHIGLVTLANQNALCHKVLTAIENQIFENFNVLITQRRMEMF
jgi:uncharacterized protein YlxP (DUF503 family)